MSLKSDFSLSRGVALTTYPSKLSPQNFISRSVCAPPWLRLWSRVDGHWSLFADPADLKSRSL